MQMLKLLSNLMEKSASVFGYKKSRSLSGMAYLGEVIYTKNNDFCHHGKPFFRAHEE